jgi:hypothetical protein
MNCHEFRTIVGAEPQRSDAALASHAAECAECAAHRANLQRMDVTLRRAMAVDFERAVAEPTHSRATGGPRAAVWRGWAMAAGVACALAVGALLWVSAPQDALASDVVAHMSHEPDAWDPAPPVPAAQLADALRRSGVRLDDAAGLATYVHRCWFRGHFVPHLVVQTDDGPVTVLVLPQERVQQPSSFAEHNYRGVIVPAQRGALAILSRGDEPSPAVVSRIRDSISFDAT